MMKNNTPHLKKTIFSSLFFVVHLLFASSFAATDAVITNLLEDIAIENIQDTQSPTDPTGLFARNIEETALELVWTESTDNIGVEEYWLYRNGSFFASVPHPQSVVDISNLSPNTTYTFYVRARDAAGNSSNDSNTISVTTLQDTTPPSTPTGLTASNITETTVLLNWDDATDNVGVTSYDVYQNGTLLGSIFNSLGTVNSLTPGTTYVFYVVARDAAGNSSGNSIGISITTSGTAPDTESPSTPLSFSSTFITDASIGLEWIASTDNVGVLAYDVYQDGILVTSVSGISTVINGLIPNTSYTFYVVARDAAGNTSANSESITFLTSNEGYCIAGSMDTTNGYISRIRYGEIDNSSTESTYSDFTSISTDIAVGATYSFIITPIWQNETIDSGINVWIDLNNDNDFTDPGEEIFIRVPASFTQLTAPLTIPVGTTLGEKRMRIAMELGGNAGPCDTFAIGEVEDYTINVVGPDTQAPTAPTNIIASNLNTNTATITWGQSTDNVGIGSYTIFQDDVSILSTSSMATGSIINNLDPDTTYQFKVLATDTSNNVSPFSQTLTITTLSTVGCSSMSTNFNDEFISRVQLNTIDNVSAGSFYTDYTSINTDLFIGQEYTITITPTWTGTVFPEGYAVWLDFNGNDDFTDPGEQVVAIAPTQDTPILASFTVPEESVSGQVKMRVSLKYAGIPDPCETFSFGEVEDYTINLQPTETNPPTAPTALTTLNITETTLDLSWNAATDDTAVVGYDIYQNNILIGSTTNLLYAVDQLSPNTFYSYYIVAKDGSGNQSPPSNTVSIFTLQDTEAPNPPTSLVASNISETSLLLNWNEAIDNIGVVAYNVYQDGSFVTTVTTSDYLVTNLTSGTTYSFYVVARDAAGNMSSNSNTLEVTTFETNPPTIPLGLMISNISSTSVDLNWQASTDDIGVVAYDIYQNDVFLNSVSDTFATALSLDPNTLYSYYVVARDASGNISENSNTVSIFTLQDTEAPTAPLNLVASNILFTSLNLSWDAATDNVGVIAYNIFQDGNFITTITDLSYEVTNLSQGTSYSFYVQARDAAGNTSSNSTAIEVTTFENNPPTAPVLSVSNITESSIGLAWTAGIDDTGVVAYDIFLENSLLGSLTGLSGTVNGVLPNTQYSFFVRARDASGNVSPDSNIVTVFTLPDTEAPTPPPTLTADGITDTSVNLVWTEAIDNIGVVGYDVYQDGNFITTVLSTTYLVSGLTQGTSYSFYVVARDGAGNMSIPSDLVTINTTDTEPPTAPVLSVTGVTSNTVSLSWSSSSDNVSVLGYFVYQGIFLIADLPASFTTYTAGQLDLDTTYDFRVVARDTNGNQSTDSNIVSATTNGSIGCNSASTQGNDYISRVELNTIDNSSGASFYSDFTGISTVLNEEETYTLSVTPTWVGFAPEMAYAVWIDYNGNDDFTDAGELVWSKEASLDTPNSGLFTVPNGIVYGETKMRVSMKAGSIPEPCESFLEGEVEDYTIFLLEPIDDEVPTAPMNLEAENILDTSARLTWLASTDNVGVTGYDVYQDAVLIGTTTALFYDLDGLLPETTYTYYVVSKDASGNSSLNSNEVLVTTEESGFIAGYYFETGFDGWIDGGLDCRRAFSESRSFEGSYSIQLRDDSDSSNVESPPLDLLGNNSVSIEFHAYLTAYEPGETFSVEFYDGVSYQEIGVYEQGVDFGRWEFFTDTIILDGSNYTFTSSNKIRFVSQADERSDQVYLDQIIIMGDAATTFRDHDPKTILNNELSLDEIEFLEVRLYPNPVKDILNLSFGSNKKQIKYYIINSLGQKLSTGTLMNNSISLETLPSGLYNIVIIDGISQKTIPFIKE